MKKKIYTTPALSVEEFEMNEVICTSSVRNVSASEGVELNYGGGGNGPALGKQRGGIWDEE